MSADEVMEGARQRYYGEVGLIALIALLSAFIPLSTDLYLPALPRMMEQYGVTEGVLNLTSSSSSSSMA